MKVDFDSLPGRKYEEVEVVMCGEFYTVIPCPGLDGHSLRLEDGEIFAVLKPLPAKEGDK